PTLPTAAPPHRPTPSARRHEGTPSAAGHVLPQDPFAISGRGSPAFVRWRSALLARISTSMCASPRVSVCDARGFDTCYGLTHEGDAQHRLYVLVVPRLDAAGARAVTAEARRVFDLEKGIWEKEVTFWLIAREVADQNQVLWTLKNFGMGWWRRRRIILHDLAAKRVFASELGCDPRGNHLKRAFLVASHEALSAVRYLPDRPASPVAHRHRRCGVARGPVWGAALALLITLTFVGMLTALQAAHSVGQRIPCPGRSLRSLPVHRQALPPRVPDRFTPGEREGQRVF
ncbi:MAG: hypothetical protein D6731_10890, partial [Planctomycetota bacterium]